MSKEKELKIRESLKLVYDLFSRVDDFLFTTYNYEPDFFDEHIVSYLMGFDRKISTIGELKDADEWVRNNHVSVYYDRNAMSPGTSCLTVPVFPQNIKTGGVFHPKVIIIYGIPKGKSKATAYLFVSSCNLTVSGYGRNKEAFSCVEIKSAQLANSVSEFIYTLDNNGDEERHSALHEFLNNIRTKDEDIEFLWTNSGKGTKLIDYFKEQSSGDLTVVSPYFDEKGPESLLDELPNKGKTTIIPAIDGENYNLHKGDYEKLKNNKIDFYELLNEDDTRFIHAKVIKFGSQLVVGSYNFTSAALKGLNSEAALIFNNSTDFKFNLKNISEQKLLPDGKLISNRDEAGIDNKVPFVSVIVQWKESKIFVTAEYLDNGKYSLRLDGTAEDLITVLQESQVISITAELANHILRHKTFSIYKDGIICFKGLINEIDSGEYRPEFSCESLNDSIREWFTYSEDDSNEKQNLRLINTEDEETEKVLGVTQEETQDIFDNYYLVARALENLLNQVEENRVNSLDKAPVAQRRTEKYWERYNEWEVKKQKADQNLYSYLVTKPGSIENMITFLEKDHMEEKNRDIVYEWLIVNYLQSTMSMFPKNLIHNNDGNKVYKEKLSLLSERLNLLDKDINKKIRNSVDKKFLEWIETEFKKRKDNV